MLSARYATLDCFAREIYDGLMLTTDDATLALRDWGARLGPGFFSVQEHTPGRMWLVRAGDGRPYFLKRAREVVPVETLDVLRAKGIPVAPPLPADDGSRSKVEGEWNWTLYDHLPGIMMRDHLAPGGLERAAQFGEAIGRLHEVLATISLTGRSAVDLAGIVRGAGPKPPFDVTPELLEVWKESKETLPRKLEGLPAHLIHRDPNSANMLFENGKLSGWVDFDLAVTGPRIFDPCYCAQSILSECPESPEIREQWMPVGIELLTAYDKVVHLTAREREALGATLMAIQILFVEFCYSQGREDFARRDMLTLCFLHRTWAQATRDTPLAP
jgi:Ser/Thr protein kinase RdoA (MazF antagonist)